MTRPAPASLVRAVQALLALVTLGAVTVVLTVLPEDQLVRSWAEGNPSVRGTLATGGLEAVREGPIRPPGFVPVAIVSGWLAVAAIDPATAWSALVGFRGDALEAIWTSSPDAVIERAVLLVVLGLATGLLPVAFGWFIGAATSPRDSLPMAGVISVVILFGIAAIVAGGSYWPPYLLQLAPGAVLAVGAMAALPDAAGGWMRRCSRVVLGAAAVGTVAAIVVHATVPMVWYSERLGQWLAESKAAGDTAFVAYGHASVLETADMASPYPHLRSLPMRALDPEQERLRATIAGPEAPSWFIEVNGLNAWGIDEESRLRDLLHERYRAVATICGERVWLRRDLTRQAATPPRC